MDSSDKRQTLEHIAGTMLIMMQAQSVLARTAEHSSIDESYMDQLRGASESDEDQRMREISATETVKTMVENFDLNIMMKKSHDMLVKRGNLAKELVLDEDGSFHDLTSMLRGRNVIHAINLDVDNILNNPRSYDPDMQLLVRAIQEPDSFRSIAEERDLARVNQVIANVLNGGDHRSGSERVRAHIVNLAQNEGDRAFSAKDKRMFFKAAVLSIAARSRASLKNGDPENGRVLFADVLPNASSHTFINSKMIGQLEVNDGQIPGHAAEFVGGAVNIWLVLVAVANTVAALQGNKYAMTYALGAAAGAYGLNQASAGLMISKMMDPDNAPYYSYKSLEAYNAPAAEYLAINKQEQEVVQLVDWQEFHTTWRNMRRQRLETARDERKLAEERGDRTQHKASERLSRAHMIELVEQNESIALGGDSARLLDALRALPESETPETQLARYDLYSWLGNKHQLQKDGDLAAMIHTANIVHANTL